MIEKKVKICGIKDERTLDAALMGGADYVGFVFFEKSPRHITFEAAKTLSIRARKLASSDYKHGGRVALMVNPTLDEVEAVLAHCEIDILQLHGNEAPQFIHDLKQKFNIPILKAIPIAKDADFKIYQHYDACADMVLFDAKPPETQAIPGGNAISFDWNLLKSNINLYHSPWFLAGGLNVANIKAALEQTQAKFVDCSSGVEKMRGQKDPSLIKDFLKQVKAP